MNIRIKVFDHIRRPWLHHVFLSLAYVNVRPMDVHRVSQETNARNVKALSSCNDDCYELQLQKSNLMNELVSCKADILQLKGIPPQLKKETNNVSILKMVGYVILFIFNIIMNGMQCITCLHAYIL